MKVCLVFCHSLVIRGGLNVACEMGTLLIGVVLATKMQQTFFSCQEPLDCIRLFLLEKVCCRLEGRVVLSDNDVVIMVFKGTLQNW